MAVAKTKLADPRYKKWDGQVLVWYSQRKQWMSSDEIQTAMYRYKDKNGTINEIEYKVDFVKNNVGKFFESKWKRRKDGSRYLRRAFYSYNINDLEIVEHKIIIKERK